MVILLGSVIEGEKQFELTGNELESDRLSGQSGLRLGLGHTSRVAFDPTETLAAPIHLALDAGFCLFTIPFAVAMMPLLRHGAGMKRREFIAGIGAAATLPIIARAQQPEPMKRIGVLMAILENDPLRQS